MAQLERVIRESGAAVKPSPRERAARALISPRISHGAGAGVGGGVRGEFAVELGEQRDAIGEAIFGAGRGERGILRRRRATASSPLPTRSRTVVSCATAIAWAKARDTVGQPKYARSAPLPTLPC